MSRYINKKTKHFVRWAQKDWCLLCNFPLLLGKHFHHLIPYKDEGPNHYLNLVALCPNHHFIVEYGKRSTITLPFDPSKEVERRTKATLEIFESLNVGATRLLNILAEPYKFSGVKEWRRKIPEDAVEILAKELISEDVKLLLAVNKERPRIFLGSPENIKALKDSETPYDLNLLENEELQDLLDEKASKVVVDVKANFYAQVVIKHLIKIDLPEQVIEGVLHVFFVDQATTAR